MRLRGLFFLFVLFFLPMSVVAKTNFSLRDWMAKDREFKAKLIDKLIVLAKEDGTVLRLGSAYYVRELEALAANSISNGDDSGLDESFMISFQMVAIMDCDWDNGRNRTEYAREVMGDSSFDAFKQKYPEKYMRLESGCK